MNKEELRRVAEAYKRGELEEGELLAAYWVYKLTKVIKIKPGKKRIVKSVSF